MKKVLLSVAAFALVATTMTSCKKDYDCVCTYNDGTSQQSITIPIKDVKKKDAKDACNSAGSIYVLVGGTCAIK